MIGTVKFWKEEAGYGFLVPDGGGGDIFVHVSELHRAGIRDPLEVGTRLDFNVAFRPDNGRPYAVEVKLAQ